MLPMPHSLGAVRKKPTAHTNANSANENQYGLHGMAHMWYRPTVLVLISTVVVAGDVAVFRSASQMQIHINNANKIDKPIPLRSDINEHS